MTSSDEQPKVPQEWLSTLEQDERWDVCRTALNKQGGTVKQKNEVAQWLVDNTNDVPLARLRAVLERYPKALPMQELRAVERLRRHAERVRQQTHDWQGKPYTPKQHAQLVRSAEGHLHPLEFFMAVLKGSI